MSEKELRSAVMRAVLTELAAAGELWVPVATSSRHCHLSQTDLERLFGPGHRLTPMRMLEQPGQFAAEEKVELETPRGRMSLRVVGPIRTESQVELSMTDARQLGLSPPVRLSGDLNGSPGCRLKNGERTADLSRGVIIAARHLHMSGEEAQVYGLKDGQEVAIRAYGQRGSTMEHLIVRAGNGHLLEAHIDTDEANAFGIRSGQICRMILPAGSGAGRVRPAAEMRRGLTVPAGGIPGTVIGTGTAGSANQTRELPPNRGMDTFMDYSGKPDFLLTEELVCRAAGQGKKYIRLAPGALVTPLARDVAWEKGIELIFPDGKRERR